MEPRRSPHVSLGPESGLAPRTRGGAAPFLGTTAAHDFPTPTQPTMFYFVASTPRSGSTFLCHELWATGVMGAPSEYFNYQGTMLRMTARLRPGNLFEYVERLFAVRTSPNGVFGFKAHWDQFRIVVNGGLLRFFPALRCIYVERADKVAQAVSYVRAEQTGQWVSWRPARGVPAYDHAGIGSALRRIEQEAARWQAMFARHGIEPMRISYEALATDRRAVTDEILRRFGLARDPSLRIELRRMERQSDAMNREWIERFHRESQDRRGAL